MRTGDPWNGGTSRYSASRTPPIARYQRRRGTPRRPTPGRKRRSASGYAAFRSLGSGIAGAAAGCSSKRSVSSASTSTSLVDLLVGVGSGDLDAEPDLALGTSGYAASVT